MCRVLIAGSSQMYSAVDNQETVIDESTPMQPSTFYGWTKAWARELLGYYRQHRNVFGSTAILFNHESSLRRSEFVTRKITTAAAHAKLGRNPKLKLIDITHRTDWSSAADVVEGMLLALSVPEPLDYVFGSGRTHSVQDVLRVAFDAVGLDWRSHAEFQKASGSNRGSLLGDATRARTVLGWRPSIGFDEMIREMVEHDLSLVAGSPARHGGAPSPGTDAAQRISRV